MTPFGTYYYPPCAGTGAPLFTNPPFKMTDQPIAPGLPGLSEEEFLRLNEQLGSGRFAACTFEHALELARAAYQRGADDQLEACARWLRSRSIFYGGLATYLRDAMRPKPLSLKQQALAILDDCNLDAAHENTLRRALEALPE